MAQVYPTWGFRRLASFCRVILFDKRGTGMSDRGLVGDRDALLDEVEVFLTGARHVYEPERVLATVLFADIVGSTERAAALGDNAWRD